MLYISNISGSDCSVSSYFFSRRGKKLDKSVRYAVIRNFVARAKTWMKFSVKAGQGATVAHLTLAAVVTAAANHDK